MILNKSIVVASIYCCGKTYLHNHPELSKYSIVEIESLIDVKSDDKEFRKAYIEKLKDSIGKYDIILVTVHRFVIHYMKSNGIQFCYAYPKCNVSSCDEWSRRNKQRGYDAGLASVRQIWFADLINRLKQDNYALHHFILNKNQYLSDIIDEIVSVCSQSIL